MCFAAERGNAEDLAHILKGNFGILVLNPHSLCRVNGRTAAHCNDPIGLELQHCLCTLHNGFNRGIGLDAFKKLYLHACFFKICDSAIEEAETLH